MRSSEEALSTPNDSRADLAVRVDPIEMLQYVQTLMVAPAADEGRATGLASRFGSESPVARAAQLRWNALNRAFGDERVDRWTSRRKDQIQVPVALIAAAGVARLTMTDDEVVFDIPALLDATLQFSEPVGNA